MYRIVQRNDGYWYAQTLLFFGWEDIDRDGICTWSTYPPIVRHCSCEAEEEAMENLKRFITERKFKKSGIKKVSRFFFTRKGVSNA